MYGFRSQLDAISAKGEERSAQQLNNPTNYKEEHNKQVFPEICSEECPHHQCPYHTPENYGKPCFKRWEQYKTPPPHMPPSDRPTPYAKASLTQSIEKAVAQAFKPITNRLEALENQAHYERHPERRSLNGKRIRVDIGTNQERIEN